jgi:hypothetical protein
VSITNRPPRAVSVLLIAATLVVGAASCSSSSDDAETTTTLSVEERYCAAWQDVVDAFGAFAEIDVVADGTDAVQAAFDDLEASVTTLEGAADEQITPSVQAFLGSLEDLGTTLTSPELPVDRRDQVRAARDEVDASWNDMGDTLKTSCPDVSAAAA